MITVLAGGVGAARFLRGLVRIVEPSSITAIVNVADDFVLHGLSISPDIDTIRYTLANDIGEQGWGRSADTGVTMQELQQLATTAPAPSDSLATAWFHLGDRDLATHLYRTQRLNEGASLTDVTDELNRASGVDVRVLPVSNDHVRTMVTLASGAVVGFQQYFVGLRHEVAVRAIEFEGADRAKPAPDVLEAIETAQKIVIAPSNPFVSIAPVLAVPGVADAIRARREHATAISPIIGGDAVKGPAARMLTELGHEQSAVGIAKLWSPYASTLVVDNVDRDLAPAIERLDMRCVTTSTLMTNDDAAAALATAVLDTTIGHSR